MYSSSEPDTCGECGFNVTKNGINRSMWLNGAVCAYWASRIVLTEYGVLLTLTPICISEIGLLRQLQ